MSSERKSPLVSVVTPFYNTAAYLAECIHSVLAQTFTDFEYLLVNNQSTDGSDRIAAEWAGRDPRIRLVHNPRFVGQVENYNGALEQIDPGSRYVKIVQADDWIFPECLERMLAVAERHPSVGLVGAYYLEGNRVQGYGIPVETEVLGGRDANRGHLLGTCGVFGTPTTLMYRADLVRERHPPYTLNRVHEDSEFCFEVLRKSDFGFVHQVLSYLRVRPESILAGASTYDWRELAAYITHRMFGAEFLGPSERQARMRRFERLHLSRLGEAALLWREPAYWAYHRRGLATIGESLRPFAILPYIGKAVVKALLRPRWALAQVRVSLQARRR